MESRVEYLEEPVEYEKPKSLEEALDSRVEDLDKPVESQMPERKESDSIDEIKLAEAISSLLDITKEDLKKLYESNSYLYSKPQEQMLKAGADLGKGPDSLGSRLSESSKETSDQSDKNEYGSIYELGPKGAGPSKATSAEMATFH